MQFAILILILGLLSSIGQNSLGQEEKTPVKTPAAKGLWSTENLPRSAVWRYGATDRNPEAIGVYALCFSSDGNLLAARDRRQNIRLLNIKQEILQTIIPTQNVLDLTFSPDDKFVVSGNRRATQLWNVEDGTMAREVKQPGFKLARSLDPPQLVVIGKGTVHQYRWPLPSKPTVKKSTLVGRIILPAGVSDDGRITVFQNGGSVEVLDNEKNERIDPSPNVVPKRALVSPNLNLLAELNYGDATLKLFDLRNAKKYSYALSDKRRVVTAAFSKDSRFLFSSNYDNSIVVWDLVTMKAIDRIEGHTARIYALATPPQLFCLASGASGSSDRSVIFWDLRDRLFPAIEDDGDFLFDRVWNQLGSDDPKVSLAATNQLYRALQRDELLMDVLADRIGLNSNEGEALANQWIEDLDARKYLVRERATAMLKAMVDKIRPLLERKLEDGSQEAKWRIQNVLRVEQLRPGILTAAGRREHRVVLALELLGNSAALEMLERLSQSVTYRNMVEDAKAALGRLRSE